MAANFLCQSLKLRGKDGVAVLGHKSVKFLTFIHFLKFKVFVVHLTFHCCAQANLANGILGGKAVCSHKLVHAVIGAWCHYVMFNEDALALCGADHGQGFITVLEVRAGLTGALLNQLGAVERIRIHCHKGGEAVSAVDIEGLGDGAESVGGIEVSPVLLVELQAPVVPIFVPVGIQVVVIGAFHVDNVSKHALLGHGEGRELKEVIAAVFKDHAVLAGTLRGVYKVPACLEGFCRRNFQGNMLAVLHGIECHGNVVDPVCADVHKVHVRVLAELLVGFLISCINLGGHAAAFQYLEVFLCPVRFYVTDSCNVAAGHV